MKDAVIQTDIQTVQSIASVPSMLRVVANTTGLRWVAVARVTEEALTICAVLDELQLGFEPGASLDIAKTLCGKVRREEASIVIDDVSVDAEYQHHPVPKLYGFQSYFSIPIYRKNGDFFGTLCGLDTVPAQLSGTQALDTLKLFTQMLSGQIDAEESRLKSAGDLALAEIELADELATGELRERLMGILGHDLRTPLSAIMACTELVRLVSNDERILKVMSRISSSAERISTLVDTITDFTRSKMGGALVANVMPQLGMVQVLNHVVDELRAAYPTREIVVDLALPESIPCDAMRISQLASNLLVNALIHGDHAAPVYLTGRTDEGNFTLLVANKGTQITTDVMASIFEPFSRDVRRGKEGGLGLGLYIAAEIAKAHGGTLTAQSTEIETTFTLTIPLISSILSPA